MRADSRINAFGAVGNVVVAGTDHGIFVSRDHGVHWEVPAGTAGRRVLSVAALGNSVYAGTDSDAMLVSRDGGTTWVENAGMPFRKVRALLAYGGALYAGTDSQGVFVSGDGGKSWTSISRGLPGKSQVFSLAGLGGRVFAGLYSKGLYVWSGDDPAWRKADTVSPLALTATRETLLAGHNPGGIFRSDDAGRRWTPSEFPGAADLGRAPVWELGAGRDLAVAGVSSRIYLSKDQGRTWQAASAGLPAGSAGISFLVNPDYVLAGVSIASQAKVAR